MKIAAKSNISSSSGVKTGGGALGGAGADRVPETNGSQYRRDASGNGISNLLLRESYLSQRHKVYYIPQIISISRFVGALNELENFQELPGTFFLKNQANQQG